MLNIVKRTEALRFVVLPKGYESLAYSRRVWMQRCLFRDYARIADTSETSIHHHYRMQE